MTTKRHALTLAAVLAAASLTGGAAILGLTHNPQPAATQPAVVLQPAQPAPTQQHWEEGD